MRLEAVMVCVDYADFLEETLPYTLPIVDDLVVVTRPGDGRTAGLCHRHGVRCLSTNAFYSGGEVFNKARGINYGLMHMRQADWVLHLDADVILPPRTRWLLENSNLEPYKIYGCDRFNVLGREAWDEFKARPSLQFESSCRITPPNQFQLGSRLVHYAYGGYLPIGYFQLWHPGKSGINRYPDTCEGEGTAERTDVLHSLQWDRENRVLVPEMFVLHLETKSRGGPHMGANWRGRTTPAFTTDERDYRAFLRSRPSQSPYGH